MCPVTISNVERRAAQVIRLQDKEACEIREYEEKWGKSPPYITEQAPRREIEVAYLEMDGAIVMAREENRRH